MPTNTPNTPNTQPRTLHDVIEWPPAQAQRIEFGALTPRWSEIARAQARQAGSAIEHLMRMHNALATPSVEPGDASYRQLSIAEWIGVDLGFLVSAMRAYVAMEWLSRQSNIRITRTRGDGSASTVFTRVGRPTDTWGGTFHDLLGDALTIAAAERDPAAMASIRRLDIMNGRTTRTESPDAVADLLTLLVAQADSPQEEAAPATDADEASSAEATPGRARRTRTRPRPSETEF